MTSAVCVTLITNALDTSPTVSFIGAALAAAVPALINAGGPHGVAIGLGVTAAALGATYVGFTASDAASNRPATFPGSKDVGHWVERRIPVQVEVPGVVGRPYSEAEETLEDAGLVVDRVEVESELPAETVVDQDPGLGASVDRGTTVAVSVSASPHADVEVPEVVGKTLADAQSELAELTVNVVPRATNDDAELGIVLAQSLTPGSLAEAGEIMTLEVGTPTTTAPTDQ
jgi:PASTA domain